jgi:hypothetical protein
MKIKNIGKKTVCIPGPIVKLKHDKFLINTGKTNGLTVNL